jgi:superfamily I DNA and/or RNA helicase
MKSPGVVIVEEAGEVLEPHILSALSEKSAHSDETKHLILIGDHLQLRPKVECYELSSSAQRGYNFDVSLFERLIKSRFPSTMQGST